MRKNSNRKIFVAGLIAILLIAGVAITKKLRGSLLVTSFSDGAVTVVVDGRAYQTPVSIRLKAGEYTITAFAPGKETQTYRVVLKSKEIESLVIDLPESFKALSDLFPTDTAAKLYPLIYALPYDTDHFSIVFKPTTKSFLIAPKITIGQGENPLEEFARQWATYEQFALEALDFIRSNEVDPKTLTIEWLYQEFWPEGKEIGIK